MIDAVVFDLDGVIIDSEELWDEVREGLARERGGRWSEQAQADMMGMSSTEWSRYMHEVVGLPEPPDEINREVVRRMLDRYSERLPLIDGAVDAVKRLAAHWPLGARVVVEPRTDRPRPRAGGPRAVLQGDGLFGGGRARQAGARRLSRGSATARRAAVSGAAIEDSANGIRSAHAAGMHVVAIPNRAFPPPADVLGLASVVLESIKELDPELVTEAARLSTPSSG